MKHEDNVRNPRIQYRPIARPESLSIFIIVELKVLVRCFLQFSWPYRLASYITIYCLNNKRGEAEEPVRWLFQSEFNLKIAKGDYDKIQ